MTQTLSKDEIERLIRQSKPEAIQIIDLLTTLPSHVPEHGELPQRTDSMSAVMVDLLAVLLDPVVGYDD